MYSLTKLREYRNYLIMFLLLAVSGMPFFTNSDMYVVLVAALFSGFYILDRDLRIAPEFLVMLLAFLITVGLQSYVFSFFKLTTVLGLLFKLWLAYLAVKLLKTQFVDYYIALMLFFSIFSFLIFFPLYIMPSLEETIVGFIPGFLSYDFEYGIRGIPMTKKTLILYEFNTTFTGDFGQKVRNCGPFWEAGAFGGYLIIALLFNTVRQRNFVNRTNMIFLLAVLTTQSTTTYLALFLLLLFIYLIFQKISINIKILIVTVLVVGSLVAYTSLDILQAKIQMEAGNLDDDLEKGGDSRMASAILDFQDFLGYPITGRGMWDETRIDKKFKTFMRNNGLTNLLARWGGIVFFIFFYCYYRGFKEYCRIYGAKSYMPIVMLIIIWVISISEDYYESPFFLSMLFLYTPYRNAILYIVKEAPKARKNDLVIAPVSGK